MPRISRPVQLATTAHRKVAGAFTANLIYKAAALFLALVLWLAVSAEQPTEVTVPVSLELEHDDSLALVDQPPNLYALVAGQARDVNRLFSDPLEVRRTIPAGVGDSVRFELTRDDVLLPAGLDGPIQVRSIDPSVITLRLTTRVARRVPVRPRVRVSVDSALRATGSAVLVPDSVTITGTRDRVGAVEVVFTEAVDVRVRDTLGTVVPLDTVGLGVQVQPAYVRVRVPVTRDTLLQLRPLLPQRQPPVRPPR